MTFAGTGSQTDNTWEPLQHSVQGASRWTNVRPTATRTVSLVEPPRGTSSASRPSSVVGRCGERRKGVALRTHVVAEATGCLARASLESVADAARLAGLSEEALAGIVAEQAAGGLRIARLLAQKYPATREAFAAGDLRVEQVQVILNAAEQAPAPPTPQRRPTPRPGPAPPHLRRRRLHPPLRLVRDPPPPTQLEHRRPHRPRQRATPVRTPPPTNPRPTLPTQSPTRRRMDTPPTNLTTTRHPNHTHPTA
jgi:hypothetical protein